MGSSRKFILYLLSALYLMWIAPTCAFPDSPVFHKLNVDNGLSQSHVRTIHQDSAGFMWFGTQEGGLNKFDGYSVTIYKHDEQDAQSISDNAIYAISEDQNGYLWVGTNNGLNRFDPRNEIFERFFFDPQDPYSISDNRVRAIFEDSDGKLWVGTKYGLNRLDRASQHFERYIHPLGDQYSFIKSIQEDSSGRLWLGTYGGGIMVFDKKTATFENFQISLDADTSALRNVWQILIDEFDNLWAATDGGMLKLETKSGQQRIFNNSSSDLVGNRIFALYKDENESVWFGGYGGIYRYDMASEELHTYAVESNQLPSNIVLSIYKDKSGSIWLGTERDGVLYFNLSNPFKVIRIEKQLNNVFAFYRDYLRNTWIGTANGLVKIDQKTRKEKIYRYDSQQKGTISNNVIRDVFQDSANTLWVSTENGLNYYNYDTDQFILLNLGYPDRSDSYLSVYSAVDDGMGNLYVVTNHGLIVWDKKKKQSRLIGIPQEAKLYADDWFNGLYLDSELKLWLLGRYGFYYLDATRKKLLPFALPGISSSVDCMDMVEDHFGNYWLASNRGLFKIDRQSGEVSSYRQGLFGQFVIYSIAYNTGADLWLGTNGGLWRFNTTTEAVTRYTVDDGIQGNEFHTAAKYIGDDGTIYMGGINGVTVFHPDDIRKSSTPPSVVLTRLIVDNNILGIRDPASRAILDQSITFTDQLKFDFGQADFFAFEFSALDYKAPANNAYAYMLEGLNRDWVYTDAGKRRAVYTALPPGQYNFKVKAANSDGVWNEEGLNLKITVLPPLWRTPLAYIAYLLLFIVGIVSFIKLRTAQIKARALRLENEVRLRTQEIHQQKQTIETLLEKKNILFANVSHELRTPLTLILGPVSRLLQKAKNAIVKEDLLTIKRNGQRLSKLVEQLLDFSRLSHMELLLPTPRLLSDIVEATRVAMQSLAIEKKLAFQVNNQMDIWLKATPDALETILLNLLSNAFKYTPEQGLVRLQVEVLEEGRVRITVEDTGCGIPEDQRDAIFERFKRLPQHIQSRIPGTGLGLALVKELVEVNGGCIHVRSHEGVGSAFIIEFPSCAPPEVDDEASQAITQKISNWVSEETGFLVDSGKNKSDINIKQIDEATAITAVDEVVNDRLSVLIIDDTYDMCSFLESILKDTYQVFIANDGESGMEIAKAQIPDLIICDVMMPGIDGFQVLEHLREDLYTSHIPVILLTAKGDRESRLRGLSEMADDYITKPFENDELLYRIQNLLGIRQLLKEKFSKSLLKDLYSKPTGSQGICSKDREFLKLFKDIVEEHYEDDKFNVDDMCVLLHLSERPLQRKLKALLGYTPHQYLRIYRLEKAAIQLANGEAISVTALARKVGFSSQQYFSACFRAYFGMRPKEYQENTVVKEKIPSSFIKARRL